MSNTSTLDPEAEEDSADPSAETDGEESDGGGGSPGGAGGEEKKDKNSGPSLRQMQKIGQQIKGPGGAGGAAAGEGAAAGGAGAAGGGAAAGAGAAGGSAAGAAGGAAAGGAAASAPVLLIVLIVVLVIILVIFLIIFIFGGKAAADPDDTLTITKSGPTQSAKNALLPYQIAVSYPGTAQDIVIQDQIPSSTEYVDSTPPAKFDPVTKTATWNLKDFVASQGGILASPSATLALNLKALDDDSYVVNQAQGTVIGAGVLPIANNGRPGTSPGNNSSPPNTSTDDFNTLMTGQGRNTGILGNEDAFVSAILKNGAGLADGFSSGSSAPQLHLIYQLALEKNVNPLIIVTIWGVEAGFDLNSTEFGCMPFGNGFEKQLSCSRNTLNNLMIDFESANDKNSLNQAGCPPYTDPFIYAYEQYTPVCHAQDGNDASRRNFVHFFKTLYGVK